MSAKNKSKKSMKTGDLDAATEETPLVNSSENEGSDSNQVTSSPLITSQTFSKLLSDALKTQEVKQGFAEMLKPLVKAEIDNVVNPLSEKLEIVSHKLDGLDMDIAIKNEELSDKVKGLESEQQIFKSTLTEIDRKSKNRNLKVIGISPDPADTTPETKQKKFIEKLINILKDAGIVNITPSDITCVSFGSIPGNPSSNFAIVTMKDEHSKNELYFQRTKLRSLQSKVYVNEDLTKIDAMIFKRAREDVKAKKLHSVWTRYGRVYGKRSENGKPFLIDD